VIPLNPSTIARMLGIKADPELIDLFSALAFDYQAARDKKEFLKEAIRKALVK
jgi:hypothetical protein